MATGRWRPVYRDAVSWLVARDTVTLPTPEAKPLRIPPGEISRWAKSARGRVSLNWPLIMVRKALRAIPWHKGACNLLVETYRQQGDAEKAESILQGCRDYFPSYCCVN